MIKELAMQQRLLLTAGIMFALMSTHINAKDLGASVTGGTTGLGLHITVPVHNQVNARFGVNYFSFSFDGNTDDVQYDLTLKLNTFDALVDWFPLEGAFRLTGGLVYNANTITAHAKSTGGQYTFNGNTYSNADIGNVDAKIDFNKIAPYIGFGFGNAVAQPGRWSFSSDFGLLFQGSASASLKNSRCNLGATCTTLANDLASENKKLNDDLKGFQYYPVIRIGASYRF
jgi:hypothetical protein